MIFEEIMSKNTRKSVTFTVKSTFLNSFSVFTELWIPFVAHLRWKIAMKGCFLVSVDCADPKSSTLMEKLQKENPS